MTDRDITRSRLITRRALVLGGLQLGLAGGLAARMYDLQVVESDRYRMAAKDNRVNSRLLAPARGRILDRNGEALADNQQNFQLLMIEEQVPDVGETLDAVAKLIQLGEADRKRIARDLEHKRPFAPVLVRDNLTWDEVSRIEINTPDLAGISVEGGHLRAYPLDDAAAHLVGYVGAVAEGDMEGGTAPSSALAAIPGFKIGKSGVEKFQEDALRGQPGETQTEVNAYGRMIRELSREPGQPGKDVTLTVDAGLQKFAHDRLAGENSAAAIVMDVHTGAIYAFASYPGFDPNQFSKGIPADLWEELLADPKVPLTNKASVTALAGLDSGAIGTDHTVFCSGVTTLGDHEFHCWKKTGHGTIGLTEALAQSCDCFFYDVGHRAGIDAIAAMANKLGLGEKLGLDLPGERPGLIPSRAWKSHTLGQSWQQGETLINAIGQGFVKATPLQLAVMTARLASGGLNVKPYLTRDIGATATNTAPAASLRLNPDHLAAVLAGMVAVCDHGTGAKEQIPDPAMHMAGKTGSAQVRRISAYERANHVKSEDLPWKDRDHALFVGYAPVEAPRYACAVIVEHGNHGASAAGPVARDLLWEAQKRDPAKVAVAAG
jgi:penicillin-binding protein 2